MTNPWLDLARQPPFIAPADAGIVTRDFQQRYALHCELHPVPFIGDPRTARVVLLHLNPGFSPGDIEDEAEIDGYADALRAAATFSFDGFLFLDRRFKRTEGARWWVPRLRELVETCKYERVFSRLACIDYFPYHSVAWSGPPLVASQTYTFEVLRQSLAGGSLVIVMRSLRLWARAVPEITGNPQVIIKRAVRSGNITRSAFGEVDFERIVSALTGDEKRMSVGANGRNAVAKWDISSLRRRFMEEPGFRPWLEEQFNTLRPRERRILEARLGIDRERDEPAEPRSLREVASRWNRSGSWAASIEATALRKLERRPARAT